MEDVLYHQNLVCSNDKELNAKRGAWQVCHFISLEGEFCEKIIVLNIFSLYFYALVAFSRFNSMEARSCTPKICFDPPCLFCSPLGNEIFYFFCLSNVLWCVCPSKNVLSAIYDERTSGPLSTLSKPSSIPIALYFANCSGFTYSTTGI